MAGRTGHDAELPEAYRANALFDAHRDDPEFGYRFLADEAAGSGEPMAVRTAWRICSANHWWRAFGERRRGKNGQPGPPVHDDLVKRDFTVHARNHLWLSDIERREALFNRVEVKDPHHAVVAAAE